MSILKKCMILAALFIMGLTSSFASCLSKEEVNELKMTHFAISAYSVAGNIEFTLNRTKTNEVILMAQSLPNDLDHSFGELAHAKLQLVKSEKAKETYEGKFCQDFSYYSNSDFTLVLNGKESFLRFSDGIEVKDIEFKAVSF